MANQLKMVQIETIIALHQRKWSIRRIARELDLHRDTVARHIAQHEQGAKQAGAPLGDSAIPGSSGDAKQATDQEGAQSVKIGQAPIGSTRPSKPQEHEQQASLCEPWRQVILDKLEAGLTAQRIYQDLVNEHGFTAKYHSVRRFVFRLGQGQPLPFRRMECAPGEEAQVDFGSGARIVGPDGKKRHTHVFRIVLSHSRKGYSEAVYRQTADEFIRCLENAFTHFGGVPRVLVPDNLKAAVRQPDWFDPELNPKLRAFAEHCGLAILPTKPRTPRHKGKIESGVGYVKGNALKGRVFSNLDEENRHLLHWETTVADLRIHGTIRRQVAQVFAEVERPALRPLPLERFPFFYEGQRTVHRDGHIEVARAYYSVPPEYLGRRVWVRWDGRLVRIFNQQLEPIAVHVQGEQGRFSTQRVHIADEKINAVERGAVWLLKKARRIGRSATLWAEAMLKNRGIEGGRVLQGLLHLARQHTCAAVNEACAVALTHGSYQLRTLRQLLKRQAPQQEVFEFMREHGMIRSLNEYGQFVHDALHKETGS
jgi:transposase